MRSKLFQQILDNTPKHIEIYVNWRAELILLVNKIIEQKQLTINNVNKNSQLCTWFIDEFDFELRSIAELSAELSIPLIKICKA